MVFIDFLQFQGLVCSGSLLFLSQLKTRSGGGDGGVQVIQRSQLDVNYV